MKNFFLFLFWVLLSVALSAQTVSQVRNQSTNPTYIPDGTTAKPPLCFNRSDHSFWGYAGGSWYKLCPNTTNIDLDPDPLNEKIVSVTVDPIANVLRINEAGAFYNVPINSIIAEAAIGGSGTISVSNVGGVVTVSSSDPDENATNECNTSFSVLGGNLRIGDACGTLQISVSDIAPLQGADNGLRVVGDTVRLGGMLIDTTVIYTDKNPFSVLDTSNSSLGCQVKRVFGFDLPSGTGVLNDNIQTSYEVVTGSGDVGYYDELGQENCDGTIIRRWELSPTLGSDKTFFDFRRAEIKQVYSDPSNSVFNASVVSLAGAQLSSSDVGGATSIQASGSNGNIQSSNILLLQGNDSLLVVAPNRLFVQPINTPSSVVGDVLTMVGANGETEWQAASGGLGVARNGLTAVGDTVKFGGVLTEFTTIAGNAGNGITLINTDSTTYQSYIGIDETIAELLYDGVNSSRVVMKNGTAELAADSTTIEGRDKLFVLTNKIAASTANNGDVLTLLDPLTGEVDYTNGNSSFWRLKGNTGTDGGSTNFVGTTDAQDFVVKTNSIEIARFGQQGNAAFGSDLTSIAPSLVAPTANNIGSMAFQSGQATGAFSTAFQVSTASGDASVAFGEGNTASGYLSTTFGKNNISNGNYSVVFGENNIVSGTYSAAFGLNNTANGDNSFTFGENNTASGNYSTAFGWNNTSPSDNETTLGLFSTNYTVANNNSDRLFTIGNGTDNTLRNNALTIWKDGRSMWNGDIAKQNTWIGVNGTNPQNFINITTPTGSLAAISTEHTPSGNYVVLGCNAGNSGIVINDTKQLAFTTTAGTTSTNLGATNTIANYGNTGFLFGGGAAATSTLQLQGSYASNALVIAANYTATGNDHTLVCNNGATAITVTLPDPATCLGREYRVLRYAGSTGTITVTDARGGAASVQDLAGTLGVTTTITALGNHDDWSVSFKAVTVGAVTSWLRID